MDKGTIIWIILFWVGLTICHEVTHWQVSKIYGCTGQHFGIGKEGIWMGDTCPNTDSYLAQAITEIVGYLFIPMFVMLLLFTYWRDNR